jgi:hypothetical protein
MVAVKKDDTTSTVVVQAGVAKNHQTDEGELYCRSSDKEKKEEGIKTTFQQRFEPELLKARNALEPRGGTKGYEKLVDRGARGKDRYKLLSHLSTGTVEKDTETDTAKQITWSHRKREKNRWHLLAENRPKGSQ